MKEYTLRELCEICGVTRRAVQWYEKHGLVESCGKNKMGHLLYDEDAVKKVAEIKALQNFGFQISEIIKFFDHTGEEQKKMLIVKCDELKEKSIILSTYIKEIEILINKLEKE